MSFTHAAIIEALGHCGSLFRGSLTDGEEAKCCLLIFCFNLQNVDPPQRNHVPCTQLQVGCGATLVIWMYCVWWQNLTNILIIAFMCGWAIRWQKNHASVHFIYYPLATRVNEPLVTCLRSFCTPLQVHLTFH